MVETTDLVTNEKRNKHVVIRVGANDVMIFSSPNRKFIIAKGAVTHLIEDDVLVSRLLARYGTV